ncbi:hypothetical protein AB0B88_14740 [Micromonospora haikouensis]|uniref:hypothetical protein n=1 Tax=Micromonospora haikouensis TaxID=686309 RepID=UPI0033DB0A5A
MASLLSAVYSYRLSRQSHHVATYHGVIGLLRELDMVDTFSSSPALQTHYAKSASWYPGITRLIADCSIALGRDVAGAGGVGVVDRLGRGDPAGDREGRPGEGGGD